MLVAVDDPVTGTFQLRRQPDEVLGLRRPADPRAVARPRRRPRQDIARTGACDAARSSPAVLVLASSSPSAAAGSTCARRCRRSTARIAVEGLAAAVTIARDADGVPLITAANDDDAAFGLGYAHAQDRLFQMELQRRYGAGRLAEIFGADAVAIDRQMRVLGLYRAAEAELSASAAGGAPRARRLCRGRQRVSRDPPGRAAARIRAAAALRREPWRPADTPRLGQADGPPARRQLPRRTAARPPCPQRLRPPTMAVLYPRLSEGRTDASSPASRRSTGSSRSTGSITRCPTRSGRLSPRTIGSSTAPTTRAASRSSPTTRISASARRASGTSRGCRTPQREIAGGTVAGAPFVVIGHNDHDRLGLHDRDRRYRGSVHRKDRSRRPGPLHDPDRQRAVPDPARDDRGEGRRAGSS